MAIGSRVLGDEAAPIANARRTVDCIAAARQSRSFFTWFCRGLTWILAGLAGFYALDFGLNRMRALLVPKNFAAVEPGVLYRSGQLRTEHLEKVIREHGIRTIICLNPDEMPEESQTASKLGVAWRPISMPGSGQGTASQFDEVLSIISNPAAQPVLVHCAAGAYRTGAACAIYRIRRQGWTFDDAVREMRFFGFAGQRDLIDHIREVLTRITGDPQEGSE